MSNYDSTYIKPPPNPSRRGKSGSMMRKRNQTDQTNVERRNQPAHPRVTEKRSSKITVKHWLVFPRLRLTNTKRIRHPASAVDIPAITCWNALQRGPLRALNWPLQWQLS
jgi:hypothetical protein